MVGFAYFVGAAVIILLVPIQALMGRAFGKVRRGIAFYTDQRIRLMNEIISGMKVIKMYSWERSFADMIADIRGYFWPEFDYFCPNKSLILLSFFILFYSTGKK